MRCFLCLLMCALALFSIQPVLASIDYSSVGSTHTQDFNTLGPSSGPLAWTNESTLLGWNLFRVTSNTNANMDITPIAITSYEVGDGSVNSARFWSFGTGVASDRALGSIGGPSFGDTSGTSPVDFSKVAGWIAVSFTNNTGGQLDQFTVSLNGEQWFNSSESAQTMQFEFGFGNDFGSVSLWTAPGASFDWTSPVTGGSPAAVDGNSTAMGGGRVTGVGGTRTQLNWANGATLWLRWSELNDAGSDHGLAIDDFSFSATAVPEPSAALSGGLVGGLFCLATLAKRIVGKLWRP